MSEPATEYKIPYLFDTPVPQYFRHMGWHKDYKAWAYITWAFSRCRIFPHKAYLEPKEIDLDPYEFVSGRKKCSEETGLSEQEVRNQQIKMQNAGLLKKSTSKSTNKYSVYIWNTVRFSENINQQTCNRATSHQPAEQPQNRNRYIEDIEQEEQHYAPASPSLCSDFVFSHSFDPNWIKHIEETFPVHKGKIGKTPIPDFVSRYQIHEDDLAKCFKQFTLELIKKAIEVLDMQHPEDFFLKTSDLGNTTYTLSDVNLFGWISSNVERLISQHIKPKGKTKKEPSETSLSLAKFFHDSLSPLDPGAKPDIKKSAVHIDRLITIDKREPEEIKTLISWITDENCWWFGKITSTEKLRKMFGNLTVRMNSEQGQNKLKPNQENKRNQYDNINPKRHHVFS